MVQRRQKSRAGSAIRQGEATTSSGRSPPGGKPTAAMPTPPPPPLAEKCHCHWHPFWVRSCLFLARSHPKCVILPKIGANRKYFSASSGNSGSGTIKQSMLEQTSQEGVYSIPLAFWGRKGRVPVSQPKLQNFTKLLCACTFPINVTARRIQRRVSDCIALEQSSHNHVTYIKNIALLTLVRSNCDI